MRSAQVTDRNFDTLADRLEKNIYASTKGKIRLNLLREDLETHVPGIHVAPPMEILDAGGGFGQITGMLADLGNHIVLCDISEKMLEKAEKKLADTRGRENVTLIHSPFQDLPAGYGEKFDLVMLHAVLEWLAEPMASLEKLLTFLKPGGRLSLMFYNLNALVYSNAIRGNFRKIMAESFEGHPRSLTPTHPLCPAEVETWLAGKGVEVTCKTGIRVFNDYMSMELQNNRTYEDTLALEKKYCRKEPFASLGRYIHMVGVKAPRESEPSTSSPSR